jgi:hypothetical protein
LVLPPIAFLRRLCGTIPPPRRHLVRYAGVFGPANRQRAKLRALVPARDDEPSSTPAPCGAKRGGRVSWDELLCRMSAADVLACPCSDRDAITASELMPPPDFQEFRNGEAYAYDRHVNDEG